VLVAVEVVKSMYDPVLASLASARHAALLSTPAWTPVTVGFVALTPAAIRDDSEVVVPMDNPVFVSLILSVPERMCWKFKDAGE
jgi:hypothetical protein